MCLVSIFFLEVLPYLLCASLRTLVRRRIKALLYFLCIYKKSVLVRSKICLPLLLRSFRRALEYSYFELQMLNYCFERNNFQFQKRCHKRFHTQLQFCVTVVSLSFVHLFPACFLYNSFQRQSISQKGDWELFQYRNYFVFSELLGFNA